MRVKLLRKLRKEARRKYIVKQVGDRFWVMWQLSNRYILCPGALNPEYKNKADAIARCDNERQKYILSRIERRIY